MQTLTDQLQYLYGQLPAGQREIIMEALAEIDALDEELDTERRRLAACDAKIARLQKDAAHTLLADLVAALDNAFISSWQSTAAWSKQLTAAKEYIDAAREGN